MKVRELKNTLQNVLEQLEDFEDDANIRLVSNTYFVHNAHYFLGVSGYDGGYLNLDNIAESVEYDDEEEEY